MHNRCARQECTWKCTSTIWWFRCLSSQQSWWSRRLRMMDNAFTPQWVPSLHFSSRTKSISSDTRFSHRRFSRCPLTTLGGPVNRIFAASWRLPVTHFLLLLHDVLPFPERIAFPHRVSLPAPCLPSRGLILWHPLPHGPVPGRFILICDMIVHNFWSKVLPLFVLLRRQRTVLLMSHHCTDLRRP